MTGISRMRSTMRSHIFRTTINIKNRMLINITTSKKLVPQRLCRVVWLRTFSTVSSYPFSMQLMDLCSAPWYINTLRISSIREMSFTYTTKSTTRITPSSSPRSCGERMILRSASLTRNGAITKIPIAIIMAAAITSPIRRLSVFPLSSALPASPAVSSSSKKEAE